MQRHSQIVALIAGLVVGGLPAQSAWAAPANPTVSEVVVTGQKKPPQKLERSSPAVSRFITTHVQPSPIGTLSRWTVPVCPFTAGLTPELDAFVTRRIMEMAPQMGAPARPCVKANVLVVFSTQPQTLMDEVRKDYPGLLGFHYRPQEKALAAFRGPIEAWHVTGSRWTATGSMAVDDPNANARNSATGGSAPVISTWDESKIKLERASEFVSSFVVIDANRIEDQPVGAIADHIALVILSDTGRRKGCSPLPSLLDAMDPDCPDSVALTTFTSYDVAFLKGLYKSRPEQILGLERGDIAGSLARASHSPDGKTR